MPVYNEDVGQAFARLQAICESLNGAPGFDAYILSDSTDPAHWIAEELAWQTLQGAVPSMGIFYRHRARNIGRKSGNIQEFCENWGSLYDYMVVLDADSLMQGATLQALVRLMDANPRAAGPHIDLANALARLPGREPDAIRALEIAAQCGGDSAALRQTLALLCLRLGQANSARAHLQRAAILEPQDPAVRRLLESLDAIQP